MPGKHQIVSEERKILISDIIFAGALPVKILYSKPTYGRDCSSGATTS